MGTNSDSKRKSQELFLNNPQIATITGDSSGAINRVFITFHNGHTLSIVRGYGTYGHEKGLFEIMPSDHSVFKAEHRGDTVAGFLTHDDLAYYIAKLGDLPKVRSSTQGALNNEQETD